MAGVAPARRPSAVRKWATSLPSWIEIGHVASTNNPRLDGLDAGEREAIELALASGIEMVLMDESEGRRAALLSQLKVTGTIAIIEKAAQLGLLD